MNAPLGTMTGAKPKSTTRCRLIDAEDVPAVINLLVEGFPRRSRAYWARGMQRLAQRPAVGECPRFGFLLEVDREIVGCLLLIVSESDVDGRRTRRANVSSWYVRPAFRFLASMLVSVVFRQKDMTFLNISPAPHTVPILEAQGYKRYVAGQAITVPALSRRGTRWSVTRMREADTRFADRLPEYELLRRHTALGCIVLVCDDGQRLEPFVFVRRRIIRTIVPAAQLVWCRDIASFAGCAGAIGRDLMKSGLFTVACDANGPLSGVPGIYRDGNARKFYRGPHEPRLGDLADTELVLFGA